MRQPRTPTPRQPRDFPPDDPRFWRSLKPGARLVVRSAQPDFQPMPASRRELEVVGLRSVAVPDDKGGLLLEYLLFDVRSGETFSTLAVVIAGTSLSIRIGSTLDDGSAASREELAERLRWLFDQGDDGPAYARCPAMPVAGRQLRLPFAATLPAPLRGDYAVPGSDRARPLLIMEYAALDPCPLPFLIVLEELDGGRVTVLTAAPLDPRQFPA